MTELRLVQLFQQNKITGWRRHLPLFGKPDFTFPAKKLVIFVDGCFWHGCRWHCRMPTTNLDYWTKKINKNKIRDRVVNRALRRSGWSVLRVWEHNLKNPQLVVALIKAALSRN